MFFSQDILQKRGGKFGIVWLAATASKRLSRRDYSSVNVISTCNDILNYIRPELISLAATQLQRSRPRFSLYLSSQLMFGVVKIYDTQTRYLFDEVTAFSTHFGRRAAAVSHAIDLPLTRPEAFLIDQKVETCRDAEPNFDPTFGTFSHMNEEVPVSDLVELADIPIDTNYWKLSSSIVNQSDSVESEKNSSISSRSSRSKKIKAVKDGHIQANPHDITMSDIQNLSLSVSDEIRIDPEKDLPPLDKEALLILGEEKFLPEKVTLVGVNEKSEIQQVVIDPLQNTEETLKHLRPMPSPIPNFNLTDLEKDAFKELSVIGPTEVTPAVIQDQSTAASPRKAALLDDRASASVTQLPEQSTARKQQRRLERKKKLFLSLSPIRPAPPTPKRRKFKRFADEHMQISKQAMQNNLQLCKNDLQPSARLAFLHKKSDPFSVYHLFRNPGSVITCNDLLSLWRANAVSGDPLSDSSDELPCWTVPELGIGSSSSDGSLDISIMRREPERMRAESRTETTLPLFPNSIQQPYEDSSTLIEKNISGLRPESSLISDENLILNTTGSGKAAEFIMENIIEEKHSFFNSFELSPSIQNIKKHLEKAEAEQHVVSFTDLCPLTSTRQDAATIFSTLLDMAKSRIVLLNQSEPYGPIYISLYV